MYLYLIQRAEACTIQKDNVHYNYASYLMSAPVENGPQRHAQKHRDGRQVGFDWIPEQVPGIWAWQATLIAIQRDVVGCQACDDVTSVQQVQRGVGNSVGYGMHVLVSQRLKTTHLDKP